MIGGQMQILKITQENASEASHIYANSWKVAYKNIVPQEYLDQLSLERWTPFLRESPFMGFMLKINGEFVGTTSVAPARDKQMIGWGEVISIYVSPEHFGKGYGKILFAHAIDALNEMGLNQIYLWVLEENWQARVFYEHNGFWESGDKMTIKIGGKELVEVRYVNK